ncbi:MAG: VWA domain-containing protein [Actinobacteria bacterium]|nr:VWA domain-containing protein [Actinomycetota bacterium]
MTAGIASLVGFGRALREAGVMVDTARMERFCLAAALVGEEGLYWVGLVSLVSRVEDIGVYQRVFDVYFGGQAGARPVIAVPRVSISAGGGAEEELPDGKAGSFGSRHASNLELLQEVEFEPLGASEQRIVRELVREAELLAPSRLSRRSRQGLRGELDLRATARLARGCGGEPIRLAYRRPRRRLRRIVAVLDVSGSMQDHSRAMLVFCYALLEARIPIEAFALGTRLTRITECLRARDADTALAAVAETVPDLQGGTRIGDGLHQLLAQRRGVELVRGATVLLHSDGLETGSAIRLGAEMTRLSRLSAQVVWLNPHLAEAGYEPTAAGISAALGSIDLFLPGVGLAGLANLLALLSGDGLPARKLRPGGSGTEGASAPPDRSPGARPPRA